MPNERNSDKNLSNPNSPELISIKDKVISIGKMIFSRLQHIALMFSFVLFGAAFPMAYSIAISELLNKLEIDFSFTKTGPITLASIILASGVGGIVGTFIFPGIGTALGGLIGYGVSLAAHLLVLSIAYVMVGLRENTSTKSISAPVENSEQTSSLQVMNEGLGFKTVSPNLEKLEEPVFSAPILKKFDGKEQEFQIESLEPNSV